MSFGNVVGRFTAELFIGVEFAVLVGASIVAGRRLWKRKKSQVEIININELRILYGIIILVLSVLLIYLFMHRDQGSSIFIALALLFYTPALALWAFVEKNKVYFECKDEHV